MASQIVRCMTMPIADCREIEELMCDNPGLCGVVVNAERSGTRVLFLRPEPTAFAQAVLAEYPGKLSKARADPKCAPVVLLENEDQRLPDDLVLRLELVALALRHIPEVRPKLEAALTASGEDQDTF